MLTTQGFSGAIRSLKGLDDKARELVSSTIAYALYQYHAHNNKTPFLTLTSTHAEASAHLNADLPGWLTSALRKNVKLGTRNVSRHSEQVCEHMGDTFAAIIFASEEERKAQRKAARVEKAKAAPKVEAAPAAEAAGPDVTADNVVEGVIEGESVVVELPESALIIGGDIVELTAAEADALHDTLMALRAQINTLRLAA